MGSVCTGPTADRLAVTEPSALRDELELGRIRGEYLEMPGLNLTRRQAQRLWGLQCERCDALLAALVDARFLVLTSEGQFIRAGGDMDAESRSRVTSTAIIETPSHGSPPHARVAMSVAR